MQTIKGPKSLKIELDETQIFPNDPGMGTPVMVTFVEPESREVLAGTWNCVTDTGEIEGYSLSRENLMWLESKRSIVEDWCHKHKV